MRRTTCLLAALTWVLASCDGQDTTTANAAAPSPTQAVTTDAMPTPIRTLTPEASSVPVATPPAQEGTAAEPRPTSSSTIIMVTDPQDTGECPPEVGQDCAVDIRSVRLRAFTNSRTGQRMLALKMNAYELYGGLIYLANVQFRFDASGGPQADEDVFMSLGYVYGSAYGWLCGRTFAEEGGQYRLEEHGDSLTCFIPRRYLHPTKPIRLQALSRVTRAVVDRAPDQGWAG